MIGKRRGCRKFSINQRKDIFRVWKKHSGCEHLKALVGRR